MHDDDAIIAPPSQGGGQSAIALFLGLYLLVLAFFILLVSISSREELKSKAVMDSLTSAFAALLPSSTSLSAFTSNEGDIVSAQEFQEEMESVFSSTLQVTKVEVLQPGRLMRVAMQTDGLFVTGADAIRDSRFPLLDRLVAAVSTRPKGVKYQIEFIVGSKTVGEGALPVGETLELRRAGAFAREMLARGVPSDSIAAGIQPGDPQELTILIHVRTEGETRLIFDQPKEEGKKQKEGGDKKASGDKKDEKADKKTGGATP